MLRHLRSKNPGTPIYPGGRLRKTRHATSRTSFRELHTQLRKSREKQRMMKQELCACGNTASGGSGDGKCGPCRDKERMDRFGVECTECGCRHIVDAHPGIGLEPGDMPDGHWACPHDQRQWDFGGAPQLDEYDGPVLEACRFAGQWK